MPHKPPDVVAIGLKTANGSWNGCMGELVRQEIDLCVSFAQTWQVPDKHEAVDFTFPIIFDYFGMLMPAPVQRSKPKIGLCHAFADMDRKNKKPSRLHVSKQMSFPRGRSMIVQKGGPLKPMLDKQILLMHQHGLIDYGLRRHLPVQDRHAGESEPKKLTLTDLVGAFILYGIFLGISLVTFIVEVIWYYICILLESQKTER